MNFTDKISAAVKDGKLMASAADNLNAWLQGGLPAWAQASLAELIERGEWSELNDRFYRYLEFGTGGMRGRTIGRVAAKAETGTLSATGSPEHANVGSNLLNEFTLTRAVIGLYRYMAKYLAAQKSAAKPKIVIAHDIRHFSRHFCELAASTWTRLGGEAVIFDGPRSTPQLSFSVRYLQAHTGVVITASHNPPHDNGFKAYFTDGAQVTPPHDKGIIAEVDAVPLSAVHEFLTKDITKVVTLSMLTNWLGYLFLGGIVFIVAPLPLPPEWRLDNEGLRLLGVVFLAAGLAYMTLCLRAGNRSWTVRGHDVPLPGPRLAALQLALSCANWMVMACALWVLLQGRAPYTDVLAVTLTYNFTTPRGDGTYRTS